MQGVPQSLAHSTQFPHERHTHAQRSSSGSSSTASCRGMPPKKRDGYGRTNKIPGKKGNRKGSRHEIPVAIMSPAAITTCITRS